MGTSSVAGARRAPVTVQPAAGTIAAAVCFALYGSPPALAADPTDNALLQEVTVTASRRQESLESVPYSISVVSAQQIEASGATDIATLAATVPGLSMYDYGARFAGATAPIIRGINATGSPARGFRTFEQDPVGTYIGNSPIEGYFQLDDVSRIEVLKGPQGTLYGAGALGGALRLIPNSPQLGTFAGAMEASGSRDAHSDGTGYALKGMLNVPLGDTLAFRIAGKYDYQPGWIKVFGVFPRTDNSLYGSPVLADPGDIVNSSPIYTSGDDWNWQRTFSGRASLLWKPTDAFSAELAVLYARARGDGGPQVNPDFAGGPSPFDPKTVFPAGGQYQEFALVDEPWNRTTDLYSMDLSYDAGFATVSSTTSYQKTDGSLVQDSSFDYGGFDGGYFLPYYAGVPTNPRFIYPFLFTDQEHTVSEELRLVSKTDPSHVFDYVLGLFYQRAVRHGNWYVTNPGSPERSVAQGCTGYYYYGASFPDCLLLSGPNDTTFQQLDTQTFEDRSVFGELTWHFLTHGQITFGARYFNQHFKDEQLYQDYTFPTLIPPTPRYAPASKTVGKVNPSYEYADHQYVYALWSQGFRRGGANSVPQSGIFEESPLLRTYQPDKTNNYEAGLKGRFANGFTYTLAAFYIDWDKPQISSSLPSGNLAVYNANKARSVGFEVETTGPLFVPNLSYSLSYAYADAKLTEDFSLPANNGTGTIVPGLLSGKAGEQLPGSPKNSLSAAVIYDLNLAPGYDLTTSVNAVYRSAVALQVAPSVGTTTVQHSSTYEIANLNVTLRHANWHASVYVTNIFDKQEILAPPSQPNQLDNLTNDYLVNPPREVGVRLGYAF
ncbi:MAG TPA: TonB-dependent receptor plug domain-containing protein [Steroidobacteraceae bacterium]|nr:TonB-dependent receptor plug domain-containing protein [Steroidobacteraceae bacterium]